MKTALSPTASAGLISDFGELPIIQVRAGSTSSCATRRLIGGGVLLRNDRGMPEIAPQPGAVDLQPLLLGMALRHQREIVPLGEEGERLLDPVDQLDRLRQDPLAEGHHRAQVVLGNLALGQVLVTADAGCG